MFKQSKQKFGYKNSRSYRYDYDEVVVDVEDDDDVGNPYGTVRYKRNN